jgi:Xaa-Pro aminopeptidase
MLQYASEYKNRRAKVMQEMGPGSIAIVAANKEIARNGDSDYPFRQDSNFYYLTGFNEPHAVLVLIPGRKEGEFLLFNRERNPEMEVWTGSRAGQQGACEIYGADQAFPIAEFERVLPDLMEGCHKVFYFVGFDLNFDEKIIAAQNKVRNKVRSGVNAPVEFIQLEKILREMRLFKSTVELDLMRKAAEITAQGHSRAMRNCKPGKMEYELEAEIQYAYLSNGSRAPAYNHIIGAGQNSCVLHYNDNNAPIQQGDVVLVDSGAEYQYYACDVTRTFPANGRFTAAQKAIYEVVLAAQQAVIDLVRPGLIWNKLQEMSDRMITQGLLEVGLLSGNLDKLIETQAFRQFYMHRIGHWLGMDVHDVGTYRINDQWRPLEPGMVFTVEPGIYIPANDRVDSKWWNIGVRIEDNILVTQDGYENLTAAIPKTVADIEALMC